MTRSLHESLSVQGQQSLIFQTYVTFPIDFLNIYNDYLFSHVTDSFFSYFGKRGRFLPPGAYAFFTSFVHVSVDPLFLTKYDKIMS